MARPVSHQVRREVSVKRRMIGAPLFIAAGVLPQHAEEVESRTATLLGRSKILGSIWVPRVAYRTWYSRDEGAELFGAIARRVIGHAAIEAAAKNEPTPKAVFVLYVDDLRQLWATHVSHWFEFWAWPFALDSGTEMTPHDPSHWSRSPLAVAERLSAAIRQLQAADSNWTRIERSLRNARSAYRLPPKNFRYPTEDIELTESYRAVTRGEAVELPRETRTATNALRYVVGNTHHRDACGRYFPRGKGEDGCLREPPRRSDVTQQHVWLNAAFRFGVWVGDDHEHYDVQRGKGKQVSPPDVYCAERRRSVPAPQEYINLFHNDVVRDNSIFRSPDTAKQE